ncbi:SH3 and multiple ankyrin repeat domains protein [Echinococcus multilocularis]|uniref:SH3 and multiple ankyrin repeat domains protein n=1 Tax=Echinococcus multilocularis TaxID=6211 RepID=A0A068Y3M3_ECHMU|nr:SH3 and multiple ankyrin repeat domains protein [Echinococcus multilocularis]
MKKFINSQSSDTDSGRFSGGATSSDSSFRVQDVNSTLLIKILITPLSKQVYAFVSSKALVNHVKQKLLGEFGSQITDSINCGLFVPPSNGRNGKFLEEDRPISAYITDDLSSNLEFTRKRRLCPPSHISLPTDDKNKNLPQSFLRAVARDDIKKVEKYLSKGFDPNFICPRTEESPLSVAVARPRPLEMIKALISGGAHKDFRTRNGLTPLHKAASIGNFEAVKALLDFGQSPNTLDANGLTPLYHNILGDIDTRICHRLLYEYAQIEIYDADGKQEIHQAALLGRTDQINLLIMYGADVNARSLPRPPLDPPGLPALPTRSTTKSSQQGGQSNRGQPQLHRIIGCGGETPLHYAAMAGQCATARRLLYWGADPALTNDDGHTPFQEAQLRGNHEVAEIINNFRVGAGANVKGIGGSEGSICGPFLPAPTYNQKRKPMTAPLQASPLDHYVTLTVLGAERKGPSRSVTIPFPVSPSRHQASLVVTDGYRPHQNLPASPSPSPSPLCLLRGRACSESDLMRFLEEEEKNSDGKKDAEDAVRTRVVQSSRERSNPRRVRRQKIVRGLTEVVNTADHPTSPNHDCRRLRSWKSSHTLNEDSNLEDDEVADLMPIKLQSRPKLRMASPQLGVVDTKALSQFRTAPTSNLSPERLWSSQDTATAAHLARRETVPVRQSTTGREGAPIPANPFAVVENASSRPVSPRQRDSHHFPRSPIMSPDRSGAGTPTSVITRPSGIESRVREVGGITRTVTLHKAYLPDAPSVPTLGLSLGTVQNLLAVQRFVPTSTKPSLQQIKNVKPASPAFNAGLRAGDYVLKINYKDVTRASHAEVVKLLENLKSNHVVLEVTRPKPEGPGSCQKEHFVVSRHSTLANGASSSAVKAIVHRSVSMAGRVNHNNGPAPYSPMLPMHVPQHSQCISPGESSASSTDEPFCSHSVSRAGPQAASPQITDGRTSGSRQPLPRIHNAADYRIRHKFPNTKFAEAIRQTQVPGKRSLQPIPKSHTVNSFTRDIGTDISGLNSCTGATDSMSSSLRHTGRQTYVNNSKLGRPVRSVPQPQLSFLPHYHSPIRRGHETSGPHRRDRGSRHPTENARPLSMISGGDGFRPRRRPSVAEGAGIYPCSLSAMSAKTPPPAQRSTFDPDDLVLPPPEEFCC